MIRITIISIFTLITLTSYSQWNRDYFDNSNLGFSSDSTTVGLTYSEDNNENVDSIVVDGVSHKLTQGEIESLMREIVEEIRDAIIPQWIRISYRNYHRWYIQNKKIVHIILYILVFVYVSSHFYYFIREYLSSKKGNNNRS